MSQTSNLTFHLSRNSFGQLVLTDAAGVAHTGVTPVRAFPIAAPRSGISLVNTEGHELAWIEHLDALPPALLPLIEEELALREFIPEIKRLESVTTFATPSQWSVLTDRGPTEFILKGEEDIRRLGGPALLIADSNGIQYLIRDSGKLDRHSRKLLDRFL